MTAQRSQTFIKSRYIIFFSFGTTMFCYCTAITSFRISFIFLLLHHLSFNQLKSGAALSNAFGFIHRYDALHSSSPTKMNSLLPWASIRQTRHNQNQQSWSSFVFLSSQSCTNNKSPTVSNTRKKLYPFEEARRLARGHGFSSVQEFLDYDCPGVYQVPKNSPELYPKEWISWEDFLGLALDFESALTNVKSLHWISKEEYMSQIAPDGKGKKAGIDDESHWIYRLPYQPDLYYRDSWISWEHFLGL